MGQWPPRGSLATCEQGGRPGSGWSEAPGQTGSREGDAEHLRTRRSDRDIGKTVLVNLVMENIC